MEGNRKYEYWLRCIQGIGNKKRKKLVEYCGSAKEVYGLTKEQLAQIPGMKVKDVHAVEESRFSWDLEEEEKRLCERGICIVTVQEEQYPDRLRYLENCPYALFYKGTFPIEQERTVAIVGARMCSSYGRAVALELGERLAVHGASVISGMAAGIDSFGHWGAIRGRGKTYAVLGNGVDVCYPRGARELYEKICHAGALLSEYPPGQEPAPGQFPARNRLISALSDVVIVVEARKKSGSLITADFALEQGKDIYAIPGRLDDPLSAGCNELIRQGAGMVVSLDDLLMDLGISTDKGVQDTKKPLEKEELLVYSCFGLHAKNLEDLLHMTKLPAAELADLLTRLQKKGWVEEYYKNHYRKK